GGEVTRVAPQDARRNLGLVKRRLDVASGKQRLMIPEPHDQERLAGKFALKTRFELPVVVGAHLLAAQIFVDLERISRIDPARQEVGAVAEIPWKMVHCGIDENEYLAMTVILRDHARRIVVKKTVGIRGPGVHLLGVEEMLDAGGCVEATRTDEGAEPGIEAIGAIAALAQRGRQAALHAPGGEAGDRLGKPA